MIPDDPILTTDPFDSICMTLQTQLMAQIPSLKYASQGWPDPKWLEETGANFPSVFFVDVSDKSKSMTSRSKTFKSVTNPDGTQSVYYELQRTTYLIQISLFTTDPQQRLDLGHAVKQFLISSIQLSLNAVDTARFVYTGYEHMPEGRDNLYQRDIGFEVTARILDGEVVHTNKTIQQNNSIQ